MADIKDRILSLRVEKKLTQEKMAKIFNVGLSTVSMWERGERIPRPKILQEICDYFNVDMDYLMGRSDIKNKYQAGLIYDWETEKTSFLDDISPLSSYELEGLSKLLTGESSIESAYLSLNEKAPDETLRQILKKLNKIKEERTEINLSKETHDFYINENLAGDIKYKNKKISIIMGDPKDKSTFKELDLNSDENIKLGTVISLIQLALEKVELDNQGYKGLENLISSIVIKNYNEKNIEKETQKKKLIRTKRSHSIDNLNKNVTELAALKGMHKK